LQRYVTPATTVTMMNELPATIIETGSEGSARQLSLE
jgi:hypothetical protein